MHMTYMTAIELSDLMKGEPHPHVCPAKTTLNIHDNKIHGII